MYAADILSSNSKIMEALTEGGYVSNSFGAEQNQNKSTEDSEAALEERMLSQIDVYQVDGQEAKTESHMTK